MQGITARLKEPSTWAGLAILGIGLGIDPSKLSALGHLAAAIAPFVPVDGGVLAQIVIGLAGGAAVVMPEKKAAVQ